MHLRNEEPRIGIYDEDATLHVLTSDGVLYEVGYFQKVDYNGDPQKLSKIQRVE